MENGAMFFQNVLVNYETIRNEHLKAVSKPFSLLFHFSSMLLYADF